MEYLKFFDRGFPETRTRPVRPFVSFRSARISNRDDFPHPDGPGKISNKLIEKSVLYIYLE